MKRRDLFHAGLVAGGALVYGSRRARAANSVGNPLTPPATGSIPAAFLISNGATMIDFAGPWEVFQDVMLNKPSKGEPDRPPFQLYTVAATSKPIRASGGMKIVPDYTFANAPRPKVIVIPAQNDDSPAVLDWIRKASQTADVTMSVCTGAFLLAQSGLLDGKSATTHHNSYKIFERQFPKVTLKRGARFVEEGNVASAGGLTSGIDLAMRVVERYFGREVADRNAYYMEYQGGGWQDSSGAANAAYATVKITPGYEEDPVCGMEVKQGGNLKADYKGTTYYFCMDSCKQRFLKSPDGFLGPSPQPKSM
jgi:putative intracellular protease/amidase/YHS domain-containing protein